MRRWWIVLLMLALTGCAHGPRVISISAQELSERLARDFPVDRRLLEVFDVRVSSPRVRTDPSSNRLRAEFQLQASDRLGGRSLETRLAVISGLRWEPRDRTVRLERVDLDLPPRADRDQTLVQRIGLALTSRLLEDQVLWRAPSDARLDVQRITVTPSGLELTLAP
jgi:hypothetical protein